MVLASSTALARERFVLELNDQEFRGNNVLRLKELLRDQHGLNVRQYSLAGVRLVAKTRHGQGTAALRVGNWVSQERQVYGHPSEFDRPGENTFDKVDFSNDSYDSEGPWQMQLQGNFKVRRVVVLVRRDGHGGGGGGDIDNVQVVRCESWNRLTAECPTYGRPVSIRLIQRHSNSPCIPGRTYGAYQQGVWVSNGCRATFEVELR